MNVTTTFEAVLSGNNIGEGGIKALCPHLAKLNNMATLQLTCAW